MAFSSIDGGVGHAAPRSPNFGIPTKLGGSFNPSPPVVTQITGTPPPATGSRSVPGLGAVPTFGGQTGVPQPDLPAGFQGGAPAGYNIPAGFTPSDVTGFTQQTPVQTLDFNALLQKALSNLGYSQIDNAYNKSASQLVERYGDPALASMAGFGLDPQAADFARQNYMSGNADLARLDKQRDNQRQAVINQLASRGLLRSGDLGYGLNEAESQYGNSRYDLTQGYLKQLSDLLNQSLQQKSQLRQNVTNALLSQFGQFATDPNQLIGLYGG